MTSTERGKAIWWDHSSIIALTAEPTATAVTRAGTSRSEAKRHDTRYSPNRWKMASRTGTATTNMVRHQAGQTSTTTSQDSLKRITNESEMDSAEMTPKTSVKNSTRWRRMNSERGSSATGCSAFKSREIASFISGIRFSGPGRPAGLDRLRADVRAGRNGPRAFAGRPRSVARAAQE